MRRSRIDRVLFSLLLTCSGTLAYATILPNQECMSQGEVPARCNEAGDVYCFVKGQSDCGGACAAGTSADSAPQRICIPSEGQECDQNPIGAGCGNRQNGNCFKGTSTNGVCKCINLMPADPPETITVWMCSF